MWRAAVLAIGISLCLLGGEFMVVDRLIVASPNSIRTSTYADGGYATPAYRTGSYVALAAPSDRVFIPPEWAPWGALSAGVLTVLYGAAIPRD
jgi:hypothetical protein